MLCTHAPYVHTLQDICLALENILDAARNGDDEMNPGSAELVEDIFYTCQTHLE
jgi:hypothetical protein